MSGSQTPDDVSFTTWLDAWFAPERSDTDKGPARYECILCGTAYRAAIDECEACGGGVFAR